MSSRNFCCFFCPGLVFSGVSVLSILEFLGEEGCWFESGGVFLLFPLLLLSGSISEGALRDGDVEGGVVLFDRSFRGIGLWFEVVKKSVISCTDPFRGVSLIYKNFCLVGFFCHEIVLV